MSAVDGRVKPWLLAMPLGWLPPFILVTAFAGSVQAVAWVLLWGAYETKTSLAERCSPKPPRSVWQG